MKTRIANSCAKDFVRNRIPFQGSHLHGAITTSIYAVYSYQHFVLWAYIDGKWHGHNECYSATTTKHRNHTWPADSDEIVWHESMSELSRLI